MSYNGSGTFNINTAGQPVVTGTVISSTAFNALTADLATGLSTAITKNGQTTVAANIPFNNFKLTGVGVATATGDALSYGQAATVTSLVASTSITDSALTSGRVTYAGASGLLQDSANLTFNGTTLTAAGLSGPLNGTVGATTPSTGAFTTLSASSTTTLSGGTANGVAYLDGSKVLTTGSALTFDGTNLGVGGASSGVRLDVYGSITARSGTITADAYTNYGTNLTLNSGGSLPMVFQLNASEQMRLTSTGLGIGTSLPKEKLDSRGAAVFSGDNTTGTNAYGTAAGLLLSTSSDNTKARITAVSNGANSISLVLRPLSSGSAVDAVTIDSSGNLLVGVTSANANGGVLQLKSGITFPATQVTSSDANTLDDYEEGTWTPTIKFGGASTGITYTTQTGTYTKIGNLVRITANIVLSNKGSSTTYAEIYGIPFNGPSVLGNGAGIVPYYGGMSGLTGPMTVDIYQTQISLRVFSATQSTSVQDTNFTNTSSIYFTCTYYV